MRNKRGVAIFLVLSCISLLAANDRVFGFESMSHVNMSRDALKLHGFGESSVKIVQITNFYNDLYEKGNEDILNWFVNDELQEIIDHADKLHFDSTSRLFNTLMVEREWQRMARVTSLEIQRLSAERNIPGILTVLGISLHAVQDFYSHSNWVEPKAASKMVEGQAYGPGWREMKIYGTHPTWFDIPPQVRRSRGEIYVMKHPDVTSGPQSRGHGKWNTDDNKSLEHGLNKDSSARPYYTDAYITAFIATRQWVEAVRGWVGSDYVWREVQRYNGLSKSFLDEELHLGVFGLSWFAGGWDGAMGKSEDSLELGRTALKYGTHLIGHGSLHGTWVSLVKRMTNPNPPAVNTPIANSRQFQKGLEFVKFKIHYYNVLYATGEFNLDIYSKVEIGGQRQTSFLVRDTNKFRFTYPYRPFTFMKATYKGKKASEPVLTLNLWLETGNLQGAGTDDSLYLRVNNRTRIKIPGYDNFDDFERGGKRMYHLSIPAGLKVSDIRYLKIEKPSNGRNGAYQLGGLRIYVNNRTLYRMSGINRWLNSNIRSLQMPGYSYRRNLTEEVLFKVDFWDLDTGSSNDHLDINYRKGEKSVSFLYNKESRRYRGDISGINGYINTRGYHGDRLRFRGRLNTIRVKPAPRFESPPPIVVVPPSQVLEPTPPVVDPVPPVVALPPPMVVLESPLVKPAPRVVKPVLRVVKPHVMSY